MSKKAEQLAVDILKKHGISELPIPIKKISKKQGIQIKPFNFEGDVSGVLLIKKGVATIGYNPLDPPVRQRFTVAHELGHYILHGTRSGLFVDKNFKVHYRDEVSSSGHSKKEMEANAFAAAILMPRHMVEEEINNSEFDLTDESLLKDLAKKFNVSTQAMSFRLANLRLF